MRGSRHAHPAAGTWGVDRGMSAAAIARDALLVLYGLLTLSLGLVGLYYGAVAVERVLRRTPAASDREDGTGGTTTR